MRRLDQSTAYDLMVFMTDSTDHVTGKTGLTLTITASKQGAAFASISPTVTEPGNGWYEIQLTTSHTDTLGDLALHITGTGADPTDVVMQVTVPVVTAGRTLAVAADGDIAGNVDGNVVGSVASVTGNVGGNVTGSVGSISGVTFPTNFSDLAITVTTGRVTVGTNNDKTGYSISGTITTLDALDTAQDTQHSTTQSAISALNDPTAAAIADAVWLETLADHSGTAGSTAEALNAAGAAGDPWTTALPGAYGAGSAGNIIGNLNDLSAAEVNAEVDTALADIHLDHLLAAAYDATAKPGNATSAINQMLTNSGGTAIVATVGDVVNSVGVSNISSTAQGHIRTAVGLAAANLDTQLGTIVTDTNELQTDWVNGGRLDLLLDAVKAETDKIDAAHAEPTGVPAANETPLDKLAYLYMALRNQVDVTAAAMTFYDDAGTSEWKKTLSDNGTTYSEGEAAAP